MYNTNGKNGGYFNNILDGNIPLCILETVSENQQVNRINQNLLYYKIKKNTNGILSNQLNLISKSKHNLLIGKSLHLNREKILLGLKNLIMGSLELAIKKNKNLINLNSVLNDQIVGILAQDISTYVYGQFKQMQIQNNLSNLHLKLLLVSGLSNESETFIKKTIGKLALDLELIGEISNFNKINLREMIKDIVMLDKREQCSVMGINNVNCLINLKNLDKNTRMILSVWEQILLEILYLSKHDRILPLYVFGIEFSGELVNLSNDKNSKNTLIENFLDAGNSSKLIDTTKIKDLKNIETNINQSKVISGLTSLLSSAVTNAVSSNSADLLKSIAVSNTISVSGASGSSFTLSKISQSNVVSQETNANFVQQVTTKVINDISNSLKENIDSATKQASSDIKNITSDEKKSTTLGGMLNSLTNVAGKGLDTLGKVLSLSAGNSTQQSTSKDIDQELKQMYSLNQSFTYNKSDNVTSTLQNVLSTSNLSKCAADSNISNKIDLSKINVTGPIVISEIDQSNVVKDVMNCVFNQSVLNDLSNKILDDYNKLIKEMIENVDEKLDQEHKTSTQGDIYAAGVAGGAILESAGDAAKKIGEGGATLAKGVGEGIGSAASSFMMPLLIGGGILVLLIIIYFIWKMASGSSSSNDDSD